MHIFKGIIIAGWSIIEVMSLIENIDKLDYGQYIPLFVRDKMPRVPRGYSTALQH